MTALGPKEQEIMEFLHEHVFDPILQSPTSSARLKQGVRLTIMRMQERSARGMLNYYWAAMKGTDRSNAFARLMETEGFARFEEAVVEFRERFTDRWAIL